MPASEITVRHPATNLPRHITGDSPVLSSSSDRGWHDIVVEHQRLAAAELTGRLDGQLVSLQLTPPPELRLSIDGRQQTFELRAGDLLLLPAGADTVTAWDAPSEVINIMLRTPLPTAHTPAPGIVRDVVIAALCVALAEHLRQLVGPGDAFFARSMRDAIAARLSDIAQTGRPAPSTGPRLTHEQLARVDHLIDTDLSADLSVGTLARTIAVSPSHFSRAFRGRTGQTPHAYLTARRVSEAKRLLTTRQTPIEEVAHQVGLVDSSHLARHFRRLEGTTPAAYRSMHR